MAGILISQNLTALGSLGIGTASPSDKLHLKNSAPAIRLEDTDNTDGAFSIIEDNNGDLKIKADSGNVSADTILGLEVDGSRVMTLVGGSVGIGTESPDAQLNVASSTTANVKTESTAAGYAAKYILQTTTQQWDIGTAASLSNNLFVLLNYYSIRKF